jgi:hypothetical protein
LGIKEALLVSAKLISLIQPILFDSVNFPNSHKNTTQNNSEYKIKMKNRKNRNSQQADRD